MNNREGYVATIGMFDGVHRGHQFVVGQVAGCARELGLGSMIITFDHSIHHKQTLTPLADKCEALKAMGIDRVEVLAFTDQMRRLTAREFMEQQLRDRLGVRVLLTGYDNRFGHNREEGFDDYVRYGRELGIDVRQLPPLPADDDGQTAVSSSLIRDLLVGGDVAGAGSCLGHPYSITGHVVHGQHIGTGLGFPTANVSPDDGSQLIPAAGVYAVTVRLLPDAAEWPAMMNIGCRPTFSGTSQTLEAHIFQLTGDLYDRQLRVSFISRLRGERQFPSAEALQAQLHEDAKAVRLLFGMQS